VLVKSYGCISLGGLAYPQGDLTMKTLVSIITLGLALAFTLPAFAAPTTKAACEKAHMTWNAATQTCK
jgi:hypothetical protein